MKFRTMLMALLALVLSASCTAADRVSIQLRWLHQFQFAGYYMALEKGYYRDAGLDVELLEGGPSALKPVEALLAGKTDFAITSSGVVIDRMEGKPVMALAAIMQTSPIVWITLKSSNINAIHDLVGRRAMLMPPPESAELLTIFKREGLDMDQIHFQDTSFRLQDLIDGKTDAYDGYISNEPYSLTQQGIEYSLINPRDYGVNFYSDVLVTRESLVNDDPQLVARVRNASLKGWEYALSHLEETVQLIHEKYAPHKTLNHLRFEARTIRKLVMPDLVQIGHMNPSRWQFIADSYRNLHMTEADSNLDGFLFLGTHENNYWLAIKVGAFSGILLLIAGMIILKFRRLSRELKKTNRKLAEMAVADQLTRVKNRNGLLELIPGILSLAQRDGIPCCFMMLDIDHFKSVNDRYGHPAGDAALVAFAQALSRGRRKQDIVARVGGEEFAILLVGVELDDASMIASRLLEDVRSLEIISPVNGSVFGLTASIGLVPVEGALETFWHAADIALYQAKHQGRDCVITLESSK